MADTAATDIYHQAAGSSDPIAELMRLEDNATEYQKSRPWRKFHELITGAKHWLKREQSNEDAGNRRRALLFLNGGLNHVKIADAYPEGNSRQQQAYHTAVRARDALIRFRQRATCLR